MTPKEFKTAMATLAKIIGPNAVVSAYIGITGSTLFCSVYPHGHDYRRPDNESFSIEAEDFEEALKTMADKWDEIAVQMRQQIVRKIALAIIKFTAEHGHCTDAALRQEFNAGEVDRYGADAIKDANEIADKGPFAIVTLGGANGAPDQLPEGATVN